MRNPSTLPPPPPPLALTFLLSLALLTAGDTNTNTVPALPVAQSPKKSPCQLDLSEELFGGVQGACGTATLDRSRCCPVLAAWLFAAHARSALQLHPPAEPSSSGIDGPAMPDDSQRCVDTLQASLISRGIHLPRPNATCDAVLCFCGIRLHQLSSLACPAAFNASSAAPTAAVRRLERECVNASHAGCTRCLRSLEKVKGGGGGGETRGSRMFGRDCQMMGLTWLLERNRTAYIPTVSAVLRAVMYSADDPPEKAYRCSPDQENMPLAVNTLQFQRAASSSSSSAANAVPMNCFYSLHVLLLVFLVGRVLCS